MCEIQITGDDTPGILLDFLRQKEFIPTKVKSKYRLDIVVDENPGERLPWQTEQYRRKSSVEVKISILENVDQLSGSFVAQELASGIGTHSCTKVGFPLTSWATAAHSRCEPKLYKAFSRALEDFQLKLQEGVPIRRNKFSLFREKIAEGIHTVRCYQVGI